MKNLAFVILIIAPMFCFGQKEDNVWMFGWGFGEDNNNGTWGSTHINFNSSPPDISFIDDQFLNIDASNSSICTKYGDLVIYTNGMSICNFDHQYLEDTINFSQEWLQNENIVGDNHYHNGMIQIQGALILPDPGDSMRYYVMYSQYQREEDFNKSHVKGLYYSHVDMRMNEGNGGLLSRDVPMVEDSLGWGGLSACRHANGRDWWVIHVGRYINEYHTLLIDQNGVSNKQIQIFNNKLKNSRGQGYFSPNGELFAIHTNINSFDDMTELRVFDFDRCTGEMKETTVDSLVINFSTGLSFSADSKKLYISTRTAVYPEGDNIIYQYDMTADDVKASRELVATWAGSCYIYPEDANDPPLCRWNNFGYMGLAPDGKIYIFPTTANNRRMSVIDYPHESGEACQVNEGGVHIPTSAARTMPNFPNYRLGPLDGSPADTLGLDNHPIAKYRYEQDTLDHLTVRFTDLSYFRPETWHWDMGDGTTTTEQYPYHTYEQNGVYEVCLTVSNENSSNTSCRTLTIGTSSTEDKDINIEVSTYPNPFVDQVLITLGEYIPQNGYFVVYDISGHEVARKRIYYGWNDIDLAHLSSGTYIWQMMDRGVLLKSGKMVK